MCDWSQISAPTLKCFKHMGQGSSTTVFKAPVLYSYLVSSKDKMDGAQLALRSENAELLNCGQSLTEQGIYWTFFPAFKLC